MKLTKKVITYLKSRLYWALMDLFGFMLLLCLYIIKPFKFIKLCLLHYDRIGHLAGDTDLFLRRLQLANTPKKRILYLGISGKPANKQLLRMFRRKFPIIESARALDIVKTYVLRRSIFYESMPTIRGRAAGFYEFNNTEPNLHFAEFEEDEGEKLLNKMSIEDNSWFICFHSRDSVYLSNQWNKDYNASRDWGYHDFRDSDAKNFLEAAKCIASLGGFAVRMGYGVAEKLPDLDNPRIIDYASYHRTDFGDIYLPTKCKFFLGSVSGISLVSTIFHVPVAWANVVSLDHSPLRKGDLFIPKKIWSIKKERFLTFREILESEIADYIYSEQYSEAGLEAVENTAEEILALAKEMNERLDRNLEYTEEDEELQSRFRSLFQPHHRSYGSPARIGAEFLQQNKELLN